MFTLQSNTGMLNESTLFPSVGQTTWLTQSHLTIRLQASLVCVCEKKKDKYVNLHLLREEVWIHLDTAHVE